MGQRHQFYYNTHKGIIAYHSQWCYGSLPSKRVKWLLEYEHNADSYFKLSKESNYKGYNGCSDFPNEIITHLITTNAEYGYYSHVTNIKDETLITKGKYKGTHNPEMGDNNDGITVIDFTVKGKPAYAFINIYNLEGQYGERGPLLKPLTAEEYALCYYEKTDPVWKRYGLPKTIRYIDKHSRLLTIKELNKLFPCMYAKLWEERERILKGDKKDLPLILATDNLNFESNKILIESLLKGE